MVAFSRLVLIGCALLLVPAGTRAQTVEPQTTPPSIPAAIAANVSGWTSLTQLFSASAAAMTDFVNSLSRMVAAGEQAWRPIAAKRLRASLNHLVASAAAIDPEHGNRVINRLDRYAQDWDAANADGMLQPDERGELRKSWAKARRDARHSLKTISRFSDSLAAHQSDLVLDPVYHDLVSAVAGRRSLLLSDALDRDPPMSAREVVEVKDAAATYRKLLETLPTTIAALTTYIRSQDQPPADRVPAASATNS